MTTESSNGLYSAGCGSAAFSIFPRCGPTGLAGLPIYKQHLDRGGCELDEGEGTGVVCFEARSDGSEMLYLVGAAFDDMSLSVKEQTESRAVSAQRYRSDICL